MGAFHIECAVLSVIGNNLVMRGLRDLLVEIGVVGSSAINGVISGKHYMRSLRVHKIAFEAVFQTCWKPFEVCMLDRLCEDPLQISYLHHSKT